MIIEATVAVLAGLTAHSLTLVAFGVDSVVELFAGVILLWRLYVEANGASIGQVERAEKTASWVVGVALLLLAVYVTVAAVYDLWMHHGAESSVIGLLLAAVASVLMPIIARSKKRIGAEIGSKALMADGSCSFVCAYMAWTALGGVALTAVFGWWWIDSIASLALVYFIAKEGWEAIGEARGVEDACKCHVE